MLLKAVLNLYTKSSVKEFISFRLKSAKPLPIIYSDTLYLQTKNLIKIPCKWHNP
jgi:hypothetical protein